MKWKLTLVFAISAALSFGQLAHASKGGVEQTNNKFVVGFTYSDNGTPTLCSGALVASDVIATARHCVINREGIYGSNYVFSAPGAKLDAPIDGSKIPTAIRKVIIPQQSPTLGLDFRLDLAFIITNKAFATGTPINFASAEQAAALTDTSLVSGYGYGAVFETGAPYSSFPRKFDLAWKGNYLVEGTISYFELLDENNGACSGDSGGPVTLKLSNGKEVLLGAVSVAGEVTNNCGAKLSDNFHHLRITVLHPYIAYMPKIKKIVCVKGPKKRTVTGAYPKCPTGYKLKK